MRRPALLLLLLAAPAALAQTPGGAAAPPDSLGEVTVTATREAVLTHEAPVRVGVLDREDVAASGAHTLADLVEARSAVFVRRYGPGGLASASLRGASASQTLVLLDGHRIADPQLGQLDLSLLPAVLFERAEVLHGPGSALYGTDGVGGVVNLRTGGAGTGGSGTEARVETRAGAWGARGASVLGRARTTAGGLRLRALAVADVEAADGDYSFFDSTRFDNEAGRLGVWTAREGTDERRTALFTRVSAEGERTRSAAGVWYGDAERGLFSPAGGAGARQWDRSLRAWADHEVRLGAARLSVGGLAQRSSLAWAGSATAPPDTGRTRLLSASVRVERPVATTLPARGLWTFAAGVQGGAASAEHPMLRDGARERSGAAFVSAVGDYGRVLVFPALRVDAVRTGGEGGAETLAALSPSLGLNVRATGPLRLKASARRAFRAPTFNDRFWGEVGDPGLRPERAWALDGGAVLPLRLGAAAVEVEGTAFASAVRDQIVWRPTGGAWRPGNVGRVRSAGWEGTARLAAPLGRGAALGLDLVLTRTAARDRTNPESTSYDRPLLYVPERQAKAAVTVGGAALALDLEAVHTGRRFTASDGSASLDPVTVAAAGLRTRLGLGRGGAAGLAVRLENATDRRYQVVRGYPMPPRHLSFRLTLSAR